MNELLKQLHDIHGLYSISIWPLALIWWIIIALFVGIVSFIIYKHISRKIRRASWRQEALNQLNQIEINLVDDNDKQVVSQLSELLKRIVLMDNPRDKCASLVGYDWINWLEQNDPKKFKWGQLGTILGEEIYAPPGKKYSKAEILPVIEAVRGWIL